jgi:hypothetical protein
MTVYCVFHSVDYEGYSLISIHKTQESANIAAEVYFYDCVDRGYADYPRTVVLKDGIFNASVLDSHIYTKAFAL